MGLFHLDQTIINSVIATSPQAKPTHQRFFENSPTPQERSPMTANTPEPFPPSEPPSALHSPPQWGGRPASRRLGAPAAGGPSVRTAGRGTGPTRRPCRWAKRNKWIWVRSQRCRHTQKWTVRPRVTGLAKCGELFNPCKMEDVQRFHPEAKQLVHCNYPKGIND